MCGVPSSFKQNNPNGNPWRTEEMHFNWTVDNGQTDDKCCAMVVAHRTYSQMSQKLFLQGFLKAHNERSWCCEPGNPENSSTYNITYMIISHCSFWHATHFSVTWKRLAERGSFTGKDTNRTVLSSFGVVFIYFFLKMRTPNQYES